VDVEVDNLHVKRIGIKDLVSYVYIVRLVPTGGGSTRPVVLLPTPRALSPAAGAGGRL
jgi:hypothetical protein